MIRIYAVPYAREMVNLVHEDDLRAFEELLGLTLAVPLDRVLVVYDYDLGEGRVEEMNDGDGLLTVEGVELELAPRAAEILRDLESSTSLCGLSASPSYGIAGIANGEVFVAGVYVRRDSLERLARHIGAEIVEEGIQES
jgi:hypothetical protein